MIVAATTRFKGFISSILNYDADLQITGDVPLTSLAYCMPPAIGSHGLEQLMKYDKTKVFMDKIYTVIAQKPGIDKEFRTFIYQLQKDNI